MTFSPVSSGEFSCNGFCEVTGRDTRLPLLLTGKGLGPNIKLSLRSLDIGPVFLGANQAYEVSAFYVHYSINIGYIVYQLSCSEYLLLDDY